MKIQKTIEFLVENTKKAITNAYRDLPVEMHADLKECQEDVEACPVARCCQLILEDIVSMYKKAGIH